MIKQHWLWIKTEKKEKTAESVVETQAETAMFTLQKSLSFHFSGLMRGGGLLFFLNTSQTSLETSRGNCVFVIPKGQKI